MEFIIASTKGNTAEVHSDTGIYCAPVMGISGRIILMHMLTIS